MRIACPECGTNYELAEPLVSGGRKVRCARCAHVWAVWPRREETAAAAEPLERMAPAPEPPDLPRMPPQIPPQARGPRLQGGARPSASAMETLRETAPAARGMAGVWLAWILSLAVLGAGGWAGWHYRAPIMRAWPASQRLYAALGGAAAE